MDPWRPLHDFKIVAVTLCVVALLFVLWAWRYMNPRNRP
jgi:hypothetical protein